MGNINRVPRGLLAYLDSQTQGENPSKLGEVVAPVLGLEPFYRANTRYFVETYGNLAMDAINANVNLLVPAGEVWQLHHASVTFLNSTGATATVIGSLCIVTPPMLSTDYLCLVTANAGGMTDTSFRRFNLQADGQPIVILGGWSLRLTVDSISAAGPGMSGYLSILYNRLDA